MSEPSYTLAADEKATPIMLYTPTALLWGQIVTKELVRVNTFLRTLAPDYVSLYDARVLPLRAGGPEHAVSVSEIHVRTSYLLAMHLLPPASEPMDYDPNETNRKMEPVTAFVGPYRLDGLLRISTVTSLAKHIEITTETFVSIYEAAVSLPGMPGWGTIRADLALIRRDAAAFAARSS